MKTLTHSERPMLHGTHERLRYIIDMHVVHGLIAKMGKRNLVAARQGGKNRKIEISRWIDGSPAGTY